VAITFATAFRVLGRCIVLGTEDTKPFVMRYRGLKSFVVPYVQAHYPVSPLLAAWEGEGWGYRKVNFLDRIGNQGGLKQSLRRRPHSR
jgi:hypothetical protein